MSEQQVVSRGIFAKLVSGGFGLAVTFWGANVFFGSVLILITRSFDQLQYLYISGFITSVLLLFTGLGLWNASKHYEGANHWKYGARLISMVLLFGCVISASGLGIIMMLEFV